MLQCRGPGTGLTSLPGLVATTFALSVSQAVEFGHKAVARICQELSAWAERIGKSKTPFVALDTAEVCAAVVASVGSLICGCGARLRGRRFGAGFGGSGWS